MIELEKLISKKPKEMYVKIKGRFENNIFIANYNKIFYFKMTLHFKLHTIFLNILRSRFRLSHL